MFTLPAAGNTELPLLRAGDSYLQDTPGQNTFMPSLELL